MSAVITITIEIDDEQWAGELSGEMWGETWESEPEDVLSDLMSYVQGWRMGPGYEYGGSLSEEES